MKKTRLFDRAAVQRDEEAGRVFWDRGYAHAIRPMADSYAMAASALFEMAHSKKMLRLYAAPIAFLARHAVELELKEFLDYAYKIVGLLQLLVERDGKPSPVVSAKAIKRLYTCHNLVTLLEDLETVMATLKIAHHLDPLGNVVRSIATIEGSYAAFFRYEKVDAKTHMLDRDVELDLSGLIRQLNEAANERIYSGDEGPYSLLDALWLMDRDLRRELWPEETS